MWVKFRHKVVTFVLKGPFKVYFKLKYRLKVEKFKEKGQFLILADHACSFDPFFVGITMRQPVYYMASQDIFNKGLSSKLIKYLIAPIPKSKSVKDFKAVRDCITVKKEGGTICIFPEGNRTYNGKLCYIDKTISKFARKLGLPILFINIEGGFQTDPRFSDFIRKGKMKVGVRKKLSVEEIDNLNDDELYNEIIENLSHGFMENTPFKSKKKAMYLERVMYYCFECNKFETFVSFGNYVRCRNCGYTLRYNEYSKFELYKGNFFVKDLATYYEKQEELVKKLTLEELSNIEFSDEEVEVFFSPLKEKRNLIATTTVIMKNNCFYINDVELTFDMIFSATCLGKNKLNLYVDNNVYQLKGKKNFSALKYMHIYFCYKRLKEGGKDNVFNEFLGI